MIFLSTEMIFKNAMKNIFCTNPDNCKSIPHVIKISDEELEEVQDTYFDLYEEFLD